MRQDVALIIAAFAAFTVAGAECSAQEAAQGVAAAMTVDTGPGRFIPELDPAVITSGMLEAHPDLGATITAYDGTRPIAIDGRRFYAKENVDPTAYREVQDRVWTAPVRGRVDVGEAEKVDKPKEPTP